MKRISINEIFQGMQDYRPSRRDITIGVIVPLHFPDFTDEIRELVLTFTRTMVKALMTAGVDVRLLDVSADTLGDETQCRAYIFLGGGDIDPALYGGVTEATGSYGVDPDVDKRSIRILEQALARQCPVLAICRGHQLLNVHRGGSLLPDIAEGWRHHGVDGQPMFIDETVIIDGNSKLAGLLGSGPRIVRGGHHQAVDRLGSDLRVVARAEDGTIEALEATDQPFVVGVQWHPEDPAGDPNMLHALVTGLINALPDI